MSSELTNTTVTFTEQELNAIETAGNQAVQEIQQAADNGQSAPVGVWSSMYTDILLAANSDGINGGQVFWFQEAGAINSDNLADPAGYFVRDITALGFDVSLSDPKLQSISDTIGENIYESILGNAGNGTSSLSFYQQLGDDIGAAINSFGLPIGSWGGAFYYWNFPYIQNSGLTVGDAIEADLQQAETFITNTAQAMADTILKFPGLVTDSSAWQAFRQGLSNLATDNVQSAAIGYAILNQVDVDLGKDLFSQIYQYLEGNGAGDSLYVPMASANLTAGNGTDALFGGQILGSVQNDTLNGGSGNDLFFFSVPTSGSATETIDDAEGNGQIVLLNNGQATALGGGGDAAVASGAGFHRHLGRL